MQHDKISIRPACESDAPAITDIYNHAVRTSTATFDTVEQTVSSRLKWLVGHGERYPVVVAAIDSEVVGWGSLSPYGIRPGWRFTVEDAVYISADHQGRHIGHAILECLISEAERLGYRAIIAQVVGGNEASLKLHERCGFKTVGVLKDAGNKFDRWLDVILMERLIGDDKS